MQKISVLFLLLWCLSGAVHADAVDSLAEALATLDQLQGDFTQQQFDESGELLLESSGRFAVLRPDYFSWEILAPDNQLIIANPDYVWHHDRDLDTVTRRPVTSGGTMTPLQVLGGDIDVLRASYAVTQVQEGIFQLLPVTEDAGFQQLTLYMQRGVIARMEVVDSLDQQLSVEFSNVNSDAQLTPADFSFTPPPGADLFLHE